VNKLPGHMSPSLDSSPGSRDAVKAEETFDCVAMKAEMQNCQLHEVADLGEEEARKLRPERLSCDLIVGGFLRTGDANRRGRQSK
jgi:hypothetical protein